MIRPLCQLLVVLLIAVGLSSCASPDPLFLANQDRIQNTNYPPNKIVGTWVYFAIAPVHTATRSMEGKIYYELLPGGRGRIRQTLRNLADHGFFSAEANLTWKYNGANTWTIFIPGGAAFRTTESYRMMRDTSRNTPPRQMIVRYYDGKLYVTNDKNILVPATAAAVSEYTNRVRRTPVLYLGPLR